MKYKKNKIMVRYIILALLSGLIAGGLSFGYDKFYETNMFVDYSKVFGAPQLFMSCIIGTVLATAGYALLVRFIPKYGEIIFGFLFSILTTASILGPLLFNVGEVCEECDLFLFYGLTIPMHFFPFMSWYTLKPIFIQSK